MRASWDQVILSTKNYSTTYGHLGDKGTLTEQKAQEMAQAEQVAKEAEERVAVSHVPLVYKVMMIHKLRSE